MTRTGKIARLPRPIREDLNRRLDNGEPASTILPWLNAHADVRAVLTTQFDARDITEQNLSDWRQGGFEDWLRQQNACNWIREIVDKSESLLEETQKIPVTDWLSAPIAVVLGRCMERIANDAPTDLEQRKGLLALARELAELRRGDHSAEYIRLQRERWETIRAAKYE